jgi:hypothetical protein
MSVLDDGFFNNLKANMIESHRDNVYGALEFTEAFTDTNKDTFRTEFNAAIRKGIKDIAENWDNAVDKNDAILRYIPFEMETSRVGMTLVSILLVQYTFYAFFGARKRFFVFPALLLAAGFMLSNFDKTKQTAGEAIGFFDSVQNPTHLIVLSMTIIQLLNACVKIVSGGSVTDAVADATGAVAVSLQDEIDRRRKMAEYEKMMEIQVQNSDPMIYSRLAKPWISAAWDTATGLFPGNKK